ncbi:MAG: glutamine--fructose-6-phosphate transaminase (isomerizing) [Acidimicrobiia bacterium]|nr:glutamine--fructose-6-phosphate transaminase (isomerizing) [Acidimicrobiia bacterium]MDH5502542.1 glutamine--fructose-6-phosphate transaminase (isomerizing) [Acidimicrobiia bacterium]
MCGIVGYVGTKPAQAILVNGLARLEYRGYDSAGIAIMDAEKIGVIKTAGRVADLVSSIAADPGSYGGSVGIGHTRWATHGAPVTKNAHPHSDCSQNVAVVHNGIIENYMQLRDELMAAGHTFTSDTDTEVVAHLVEQMGHEPLEVVVRNIMEKAEGALAIGVVRASDPDLIVAARRGSPLVIGLGDGESFLASDIPAILEHTRRIAIVGDDNVVSLTPGAISITDLAGNQVEPVVRDIEWDLESAERGGYDDFMLKEIYEQPKALTDTLAGRIDDHYRIHLPELDLTPREARAIDKVFVVACGTSYHAGLMAKYAIERWTRLPVEIDIASEFRYRDPVLDDRTMVIGMSQSGETADTLAAIEYAQAQGAYVVATTNVVDSSMARVADSVLYTRAGPEIGVASTKTFVCQLVLMQLLALYLAQIRGALDGATVEVMAKSIRALPGQVEKLLEHADDIMEQARKYTDVKDVFFLGRGVSFPIALEGALKLKEIAYVRAEGYPAGEMKHGPIALIEQGVLVVGVATKSHLHAKTLSNMEEMKARAATLFMVLTEGDTEGQRLADDVAWVPPAPELIAPVTAVIPLQLFAYAISKAKGLDVDKPRNLAKTVTVE